MTINEAYLVVLKTTVISTYIPVMNPGLYDTFPESFPGCIAGLQNFRFSSAVLTKGNFDGW